MKKIQYLTAALLIVVACVAVIYAKAKTYSMTVNNQSTHFTGYVEIHCTDYSTTSVTITGTGNFNGNVSAGPGSVSINGYSTTWGNVGWAIDTHNDTLKVDCSGGSNYIVVQDQSVVQ
jgi:hypothetical protein